MCIVSTVRYVGCPHVCSYAETVHDNAIYCGKQQVIDDGFSELQEKCEACQKKERELRGAMGDATGGRREVNSREDAVVISTEQLVFVEDYFGDGTGTKQIGDSVGSEEWHVVQEEDVKGHDIPGVEDDIVSGIDGCPVVIMHDNDNDLVMRTTTTSFRRKSDESSSEASKEDVAKMASRRKEAADVCPLGRGSRWKITEHGRWVKR